MKKKAVWIVIVLVLIGAVLGYVFFSLFAGRNTAELAQYVVNISDNGYLSAKNTANTEMDAYLENMSQNSELSREKSKIVDYQNFFKASESVAQFFGRQLLFTQYTKTYREQRKIAQDNFNAASKMAASLETFIHDTMKSAGSSRYWQASTWKERCDDVQKMMNQTADAFIALSEIYQTCVESQLLNNDFTKVLFMAVKNSLKDVKDANKTTGGAQLSNLASYYMSLENEQKIIQYNYNENWKTEIEKIIAFGETAPGYESFLNGTLLA